MTIEEAQRLLDSVDARVAARLEAEDRERERVSAEMRRVDIEARRAIKAAKKQRKVLERQKLCASQEQNSRVKRARREAKAIQHNERCLARKQLNQQRRAALSERRQKWAEEMAAAKASGIDPSVMSVMRSEARKRAAPWEGRGRRD